MKLAIVIGISEYQHLEKLPACANDAVVFKNLLHQTMAFSEVCFVDSAASGRTAKLQISEFVEKHKSKKIEELVVYFSGHGARVEDDFFYTFVDYKSDKKESAGLRNTELDRLIRTLSPDLTIKIVDACNSGTTYIKSEESDVQRVYEKSAQENQLKRLYFLHSSAADAKSWAGPNFSHFTQALLSSLLEKQGPVRYMDVIADVADAMAIGGAPTPTFVIQAQSTEVFVTMDSHLVDYLSQQLGLSPPDPTTSKKDDEDIESEPLPSQSTSEPSIVDLAAMRTREVYCTKDEAEENLRALNGLIEVDKWHSDLRQLFDIQFKLLEVQDVPNRAAIGRWVKDLKDDDIFAQPSYEDETYTVEEYREIPRKPSTFGLVSSQMQIKHLFREKEVVLEKVSKVRSVISGFSYTVEPVFMPREIRLSPSSPSLETYVVIIVFLYSRRNLNGFYAIEHLKMTGWDTTTIPTAEKFKHVSAPLKHKDKIEDLVLSVIEDVHQFVMADVKARLGV